MAKCLVISSNSADKTLNKTLTWQVHYLCAHNSVDTTLRAYSLQEINTDQNPFELLTKAIVLLASWAITT